MWKVRKVEQQRESERRRRVHDEGGSYDTLTANIISGNPASCVEDRTRNFLQETEDEALAYCQRDNAKSVNDESRLNDQTNTRLRQDLEKFLRKDESGERGQTGHQMKERKEGSTPGQKLNDQEFDYSYTFSARKAISRILLALPPRTASSLLEQKSHAKNEFYSSLDETVFTGLKQRMASSSYRKVARKNCQTAVSIVYCPTRRSSPLSRLAIDVETLKWWVRCLANCTTTETAKTPDSTFAPTKEDVDYQHYKSQVVVFVAS
ncbi:hypothetical protein G5I_11904 [Acromyrmex echinatior]|uniref:Uncharacterized protein n=1 Tax=Acromyrmex echinatior TaxID=103372 RepID=F4X0W0_ACREC|nr:hypothetical protein G5I_11904 [Acromyrmex echinatior]